MNYNTKSYHVVLSSFSNWILSDLSRCAFLNVYYTLIKTLLKIIAAIIQNPAASFGCYRFINNTHCLSWTLIYLHSRNVLLWIDDTQLYDWLYLWRHHPTASLGSCIWCSPWTSHSTIPCFLPATSWVHSFFFPQQLSFSLSPHAFPWTVTVAIESVFTATTFYMQYKCNFIYSPHSAMLLHCQCCWQLPVAC